MMKTEALGPACTGRVSGGGGGSTGLVRLKFRGRGSDINPSGLIVVQMCFFFFFLVVDGVEFPSRFRFLVFVLCHVCGTSCVNDAVVYMFYIFVLHTDIYRVCFFYLN